jgi:hypothetical protein
MVILEVGVEQRRPALVVTAVNGVTTRDQHINTLHPTGEGRKVKGCGQVGILTCACSEDQREISIFKRVQIKL